MRVCVCVCVRVCVCVCVCVCVFCTLRGGGHLRAGLAHARVYGGVQVLKLDSCGICSEHMEAFANSNDSSPFEMQLLSLASNPGWVFQCRISPVQPKYTHTGTHTHTHRHTHTHTDTQTRTHTGTQTRTHTRTHNRTHARTIAYTHNPRPSLRPLSNHTFSSSAWQAQTLARL